jgi:hypothetical protein
MSKHFGVSTALTVHKANVRPDGLYEQACGMGRRQTHTLMPVTPEDVNHEGYKKCRKCFG